VGKTVSLSVSIKRWQAAREKPIPGRGLRPEVLIDQGILGDPNDPEDACRRARGLVQQARYHDARELLTPHLGTPGPLGRHILELMAQCAMYAGSPDWNELIGRCLAVFRDNGDVAGTARAHRNMGEMMLWVGRLRDADRHLRDAAITFSRVDDAMRLAVVDCLRALVRLRSGHIVRAHRRIDHAVKRLGEQGQPRGEALARLDRARILACRGEGPRAARDILLAERALGVSGSAEDRLLVRLTHAETLLTMGEHERAASGLLRLFADADGLEDVATCGWMHLMLGQALTVSDAIGARRHLMRARHIYDDIGQDYPVASCDIALVRVEHRLGLDTRSRLQAIGRPSFADWPLLEARLTIARVEVGDFGSPELGRAALYQARAFGAENGHRALVRDIDQTLVAAGLAATTEIEELTPVDTVTGSGVHPLEITASVRRPQPMVLTPESKAPLGERPHRSKAERIGRVPTGHRAPRTVLPERSRQ
jgi:hypothetical protein